MRALLGTLGILTIVAGAADFAGAQSMVAAAEKEKQRRAKLAEAKAEPDEGRVYGDEELRSTKGEIQTTDAPAVTESADSSEKRRSVGTPERPFAGANNEARWRARADKARSAVEKAEARVADLEARLASLGGHVPGPLPGACSKGRLLVNGRMTGSSTTNCDPKVLLAQESQRVYSQLQSAKRSRERARATLEELPDQARRAGAEPGWVR